MSTLRVRNLDKLKAKLGKVPPNVRAAIVKATDKNADQMVALAKRLAPRRTGALAASIRKEDSSTELGKQVVAGNEDAYYAGFVEFGTRAGTYGDTVETKRGRRKVRRTHPGTRAQPFFFPAYRALKKTMKGRLSRAVKAALSDLK